MLALSFSHQTTQAITRLLFLSMEISELNYWQDRERFSDRSRFFPTRIICHYVRAVAVGEGCVRIRSQCP